MVKKISFIFLIILLIFNLGCTESLKEQLLDYVNIALPPAITLENEALEKYSIAFKEYSDDTNKLYLSLEKNIIPKYEEFVGALNEIETKSPEITNIHQLYIKGANKQLEALIILKNGYKEKDNKKILAADKLLEESRKYMKEFKDAIVELAEEYNIDYKIQ
ncbi:hypothetical protein [Clostridiisalibacter paucivorans]|uniref:hypothetical protein n=1 Tax=Clostridiisalibacter paucivorans TaxID=408753 RepID=UPI00047D09A1|nr:hypothetical protein [Clostridiisalibacter paucivorans]